MTYRDLLKRLEKLNDNQLDKTVILWSIEDSEFSDIDYNSEGNIEITQASDKLNDEDATYFVVSNSLCGLYKVWQSFVLVT